MMISRVSSDAQTEKTTPTSLEQPSVTKSLKSSNSSESKVQLTANKPTAKRKLQSEGKNSDKKKPKLQSSELRTTFEYNGIGSCNTEVSFVNKEDKILIPSWRLSSPTPGQSPKVKSEVKTEVSCHNCSIYVTRLLSRTPVMTCILRGIESMKNQREKERGGTYRGLERSYNINIYWTDTREFMRRP